MEIRRWLSDGDMTDCKEWAREANLKCILCRIAIERGEADYAGLLASRALTFRSLAMHFAALAIGVKHG